MKHSIIFLGAFFAAANWAAMGAADVTYEKIKEGDKDIDVVRLTVTPAAEPVPALRHRFVSRDIDLQAGNAVPYYYRAQLELSAKLKELRDKFDEDQELSQWYGTGGDATPIAKLPLDKVRAANAMFEPIYRNHLQPAFARNECNWELGMENLRGFEVISFLLPECQNSRQLARLMAMRTRLAIAEHRYDDAIETMRNLYRLGGDVARMPFLVSGLVGIAIDGSSNGTLVELIANPGSPNTYWALAELSAIDLRPATRFEMGFGPRMFPFIDHAETANHTPQEWNRLFATALGDLLKDSESALRNQLGSHNSHQDDASAQIQHAQTGIAATAFALLGYSHAKERLIAQGMDREQVEQMPVGQVLAIYSERIYRRFADDYETSWYLPFADMRNSEQVLQQQLLDARPFGTGEDREVLPIVSLLLPAMYSARSAQVRLERELAALRVIESLRMYAAAHDGELPASLDEIKDVPVPLNPATAKPFVYHLKGRTAVLELPPSDGINGGNRRYEIQIAGHKK